MTEPVNEIPGFAPSDPTDGRNPLDWKSNYTDPEARRGINREGGYLGALLVLTPVLLLVFWLRYPKGWLGLDDARYATLLKYSEGWLGGTLGGTLFALKWLYHTVAKRTWHLDRRLWRFFTPHISGALAFVLTALTSSGVIRILDSGATQNGALIVGMAFLVGYFSDNALAKLSELAETLFGASRNTEQHRKVTASEKGSIATVDRK